MTNIDNFARQFLSVCCLGEGLFFGYLIYLSLGFDTRFYGHYVSRTPLLVYLLTATLFFYVSSALLRNGPRAVFMSAILFSWAIIWVASDTLAEYPYVWQESIWGIVPAIALLSLLVVWSKEGTLKKGQT